MEDPNNYPLFVAAICLFVLAPCAGMVISAGIFYVFFSMRAKGAGAWQGFAEKYGYTYQPPGFLSRGYGSMSGQFEGRAAAIFTETKGGRHSTTWTIVSIQANNPAGAFLSVGSRGIAGSLSRALGGQDIAIGVKDFDERFTVQSKPPELASKILIANPDLRAEIHAAGPWDLKLKEQAVSCSVVGTQAEEAVLLNLLRLALKFAKIMETSV